MGGDGRKRQQLSHAEIVAASRLVMECAELWSDPSAWRMHLVEGVQRATGASVVGCELYEMRPDAPQGSQVALASTGWTDERTKAEFIDFLARVPPHVHQPPELTEYAGARLFTTGRASFLLEEAVDPAVWRQSLFFEAAAEPAGFHDSAGSMHMLPHVDQFMVVNLSQRKGDRKVQRWQIRTLALVQELLGPLVGRRLAVEGQRSVDGLSPRRRQVLDLLLDGLSEKEVAHRLKIKPNTAHQYVGEIYRHFNVNSRAELMAYFIKREPS